MHVRTPRLILSAKFRLDYTTRFSLRLRTTPNCLISVTLNFSEQFVKLIAIYVNISQTLYPILFNVLNVRIRISIDQCMNDLSHCGEFTPMRTALQLNATRTPCASSSAAICLQRIRRSPPPTQSGVGYAICTSSPVARTTGSCGGSRNRSCNGPRKLSSMIGHNHARFAC